jgi:peptidoglycan/xylan/chitin deacetylase (PgdA/CDA1 family)
MQTFVRVLKIIFSLHYLLLIRLTRFHFGSFHPDKRNRPTILLYHEISDGAKRRFVKQIDVIRTHADITTIAGHNPVNSLRTSVAITFDDGLNSSYFNGVLELVKRNIPCTIFVPSCYLGQHPAWKTKQNFFIAPDSVLSLQQLKEAPSHLVHIGHHSCTHRHLHRLSEEDICFEIVHMKDEFARDLGRPIVTMAFPFGQYNDTVVKIAKAGKYLQCFADHPVLIQPFDHLNFVFGRINVSPYDSNLELRLKIMGAYQWTALYADITTKKYLLKFLKRRLLPSTSFIGN